MQELSHPKDKIFGKESIRLVYESVKARDTKLVFTDAATVRAHLESKYPILATEYLNISTEQLIADLVASGVLHQ